MTLTLKATRDLEFPNRVIYRANRRFIGHRWIFYYPDEEVKKHHLSIPKGYP